MKTKMLVLGILSVVGVLAVFALLNHRPAKPVLSAQSQPTNPAQPVSVTPTESVSETPPPNPVTEWVKPTPTPQKPSPVQAQNKPAQPATTKEPLHDPDAREALALVGMDPDAEQYWLDAIFDTSLPDNEREDLMEDLNETGFADPKNLTADDLPLIMNRLQIIDAVLPSADDFMTDHLREAQKDLVNMYARLMPNR